MQILTRKSIPNRSRELPGAAAPEHPKSTQNRSRDSVGTPRGAQEHSEGIPEASWKHLGAPPARPGIARGVPKSGPGRQEDRPGAPGSAPRPPTSTPSRARARKIRFFPARLVCEVSSQRFSVDFCTFSFFVKSAKSPKYHACQQNQGFGHSHRESRRSRNVASENDENRFKIEPKSSKIASRALLGALVGRLLPLEATRSSDSVDFCRSKCLRRATRGDQVGRSGSLGPPGRARWFVHPLVPIRQFEEGYIGLQGSGAFVGRAAVSGRARAQNPT